jgi:hypothetical protein
MKWNTEHSAPEWGPGRPPDFYGPDFLRKRFITFVLDNKEILKQLTPDVYVTFLASAFGVSYGTMQKLIIEIKDQWFDGMKITLKHVGNHLVVHINPPGHSGGSMLVFPVVSLVVMDKITKLIGGRLLSEWKEGPRFPLVRAILS